MTVKYCFFSLLLFLCGQSIAQNLTGVWRGYFGGTSTMSIVGGQYKYEVQINDLAGKIGGVTYSYQDTRFYGKASMKGTRNGKTGKILLQELTMLELKITGYSEPCIMTCYLEYSRSGNEEFLEGMYTSINLRDSSDCGRGTVRLRKVPFSDFKPEPFLHKMQPGKLQPNDSPSRFSGPPDPRDQVNSSASPKGKTPPKTPPTNIPPKNTPPKNNPPTTNSKPNKPINSTAQKNNATPPPSNNKKTLPKTSNPTTAKTEVNAEKSSGNIISKSNSGKASEEVVVQVPEVKEKLPPLDKIPLRAGYTLGRKNIIAGDIEVPSSRVNVRLYDNGEIDKDSISVYLNGKLLLKKQMLTARPIELTIDLPLDEDEPLELVMVAENLGEIPPNTALMVVESGNFRREVRLSSTLAQNAVVRFRKKQEP